jgi:hypothetical protein
MTFRRRLGVLGTVASGLLVAGLLLSAPAFAWSAEITRLEAACPPGSDKDVVTGSVTLSLQNEAGHVVVVYSTTGDSGPFVAGAVRTFTAGQTIVDFDFPVAADEGKVWVQAMAHFETSTDAPTTKVETVDLEKCKGEETTTTTTEAPTTTVPPTTEAPTTTVAPPTTEAPTSTNEAPGTTATPTTAGGALGGETTTTAGSGNLPFTGSNAAPMLIAAMALVLGGGGLVLANRIRSRHAAK